MKGKGLILANSKKEKKKIGNNNYLK